MSTTYKQLVAGYLQRAADSGLSRREIASRLGLRHGNYISMLMSPSDPAMLSPSRIPALSRLCGLTPLEQLQLVNRRVVDFPDAAVQLSTELLRMVMTATALELERRRGPATGGLAC